jgi:hypothetical protein
VDNFFACQNPLKWYHGFNMARISYQLMPPEYEEYFRKFLSPNWRFVVPRIMVTERLLSRAKKKVLIEQSYFRQLSDLWWSLTEQDRADWNEAAAIKNWSGWQLFVQDTSIRIKREIPGTAVPSNLYQSWVGHLEIKSPASAIELVQPHPKYYWTWEIIPGRSPLKTLRWVKEDFSLPLKIELSYKADLTGVDSPSFARFYANIWSLYQGRDIFTPLTIDLDFQTGWKRASVDTSEVLGLAISYDLYFHLSGVRGDLFFDNLAAEHSGFNWARDTHCKEIDEEFMRGFFQVLRPWIPVEVPTGAKFFSDYSE